MKRQKSFNNNYPTLFLVATPIGNLSELTPRAIEVLSTVDYIAAEDTRQTKKLLAHFDIHTKVISHHKFNERESANGILQLLGQGKNVALVSDAGYPLISDPGQWMVALIADQGYNIVPVSGSSAVLNGLVASGLSTEKFVFLGFLGKGIEKELHRVRLYPETIILYEAPHRIEKTVSKCLEILGDRSVCLARELTKKFEEFYRGSLSELMSELEDIKGEIVLIIEGYQEVEHINISISDITQRVDYYIALGFSKNDAIKATSKELGVAKNEVYRGYHKLS